MTEPLVGKKFGTVEIKAQEMREYAQKIGGKIQKKNGDGYVVFELLDKNGKQVAELGVSEPQTHNCEHWYDAPDGTQYRTQKGGKLGNRFTYIYSADGMSYAHDTNKDGIVQESEVKLNAYY